MVVFIDQKDPVEGLPVTNIKINSKNTEKTLKFIKQKWKGLIHTYPFEYEFLKDSVSKVYEMPRRLLQIFNLFAFLCVFISCLGLFGLSSFIAERRTKEIGIRKVHGASVRNILINITFSFIKLILIAGVFASVMSYYMAEGTGEMWIYSPEINMWVVSVAVLCIVITIALVTVSYHVIKAAYTDPVETLRYE
jgi:putative ABC transport system permease protein